MIAHQARCSAPPLAQSGATMVEFAIVAALFFSLLLGIMDFGRILFTWNSASEATRLGARIAVVCDKLTPNQVRDRMKKISSNLTDANIVINYYDPPGIVNNGCSKATCKAVEVSLTGVTFEPISPFLPWNLIAVPDFRTYLLRESMEAINAAGDQNPVCFI
jgi:Flp pilus assembly protein TadG